MKKQPIYRYYFFGTCLRYLQDTQTGYPIRSDGGGATLDNINSFYKYLDDMDLPVTRRVAQSKLEEIRNEFEKSEKDATVSGPQSIKLRKGIREIRITLDAEIKGIYAYTPTPKRVDIDKLLSDVKSLFSPNVYDRLPEIARSDFSEAGRCIAFELPTAGAFHILRATESVLRHFYEQMIKQNRIKSRMWGPIVDDLRKRNKTKGFDVLNNHLDNIRASFRNPTQHPEATYDIHEVQDLWSICADVVNRMMKILAQPA